MARVAQRLVVALLIRPSGAQWDLVVDLGGHVSTANTVGVVLEEGCSSAPPVDAIASSAGGRAPLLLYPSDTLTAPRAVASLASDQDPAAREAARM